MTRQAFQPGPHQHLMREHMLEHERCAVWAGMGMGKTSSTLTVLDDLTTVEPGPALAIAPLRVARSTWPNEAAKWDTLKNIEVSVVVGSVAERIAALKRDASVYTINYDVLPWLIEWHLDTKTPWRFTKIVADESTRLKSFRLRGGGRRAHYLARVAHTRVKRWINLTGTPSPNGLHDLWGQMWFLDGGSRLGRTIDAFRQRWFNHDQYARTYTPHQFAQAQIQTQLRDICITLDPKDYFDISDPIVRPVYVDLPPKARMRYREMEREMFTQLEGHEVEAFTAATRTMKCLQLANGAAYIDDTCERWAEVHDEKLQALESVVEEAAGMPVLVAYHFRSDLFRILKAFPKARFLDEDPKTERDWNAGKIPMLVGHPKSMGHGLNLQDGSNICAIFGHWWNLEEYMQFIERIGPVRQMQAGHNRGTIVYPIIARDTVDEDVMYRRESKREVQDILLEAMKRRPH